jgi:hypothetical protein
LLPHRPHQDNDPTAELEEIVHHTERILNAVTAVHKVNKDGVPIITTSTIIEGLGYLQPSTTSNQ